MKTRSNPRQVCTRCRLRLKPGRTYPVVERFGPTTTISLNGTVSYGTYRFRLWYHDECVAAPAPRWFTR